MPGDQRPKLAAECKRGCQVDSVQRAEARAGEEGAGLIQYRMSHCHLRGLFYD